MWLFAGLIVSMGVSAWLGYRLLSLHRQLDEKRYEVQILKKQRTDFVANVSHELKTPLTSIRGYTETLRDGAIEDPSRAKEFLRRIHDNTKRLDLLIHDILDLSRLEATDTHLSLEEISLESFFEDLRNNFAIRFDEKKQALRLDIAIDSLVADRHLIEQAFSNLVSNANRYCPNGSIIEVRAREVNEDSQSWYRFDVIDNGPGIESKDLERIFERFYRAEKSRSRALGGTGLGLAIVKHVILSHGGKVKVANLPQGGLCFSLYIPKKAKGRLVS